MFLNDKLTIPTLEENQIFYQAKYKKDFDLVDIEPSSALGSDLAITSEIKKTADEFTQNALMQNSPFEAIDEGLDNLCFLRGIKRKIDEHSVVLLTFTGVDGLIVDKGTIVEHLISKEQFIVDEKGTIIDGKISLYATAVNSGRVSCDAGTITKTELENITVTNPFDGFLGFDKESNTDLRKRLLTYDNALNIDEQIQIRLQNLQNVKYVNIESNKELEVDENGITPKSTSIIVLGGDSKEIARTIHKSSISDKKIIGNVMEVVTNDISNKPYVVYFSRPEPINNQVSIIITKNDDFNPDDVGVIRESTLDFHNAKFKISNDVLIDSLYIPTQQNYNDNSFFKGIEKVEIKINNATENIPILYNQYSVLDNASLTVTVV